jgi:hypothetical protein
MPILPGQFNLESLDLFSTYGSQYVNLIGIYQQINIFESILAPCLTGYVVVTDTFNLISGTQSLPIMGNDLIQFTFNAPDFKVQNEDGTWSTPKKNTISFTGKVTDIKNMSLVNEGAQNYEIHFCSEELILDKQIKISQSYKDMSLSKMVSKIFSEYYKNTSSSVEFEDTLHNQSVVVPSWSPLKAISWLASRSISKKHNTPQFFFYQTLYNDGIITSSNRSQTSDLSDQSSTKYWFVSTDELIDLWGGDVRKTIFYSPITKSMPTSPRSDGDSMNFSNALNYEIIHSFDTLNNVSRGMFNSRLLAHDITNKTLTKHDYQYDKNFGKYKHVNSSPFSTGVVDSFGKTFTDPSYAEAHKMLASSGTNENPNYLSNISSARLDRIQSLNNFRLRIILPGDGLIESGDLINFELNSIEAGKQARDPFYSGKYMVNSIRHTISRSPSEYRIFLDCSKESLNIDVKDFKPGA